MDDTHASNLSLETRYRRIVTPIPVPESLPVLQKIRQFEPRATDIMPPVVWDRADDFQIYDAYGTHACPFPPSWERPTSSIFRTPAT